MRARIRAPFALLTAFALVCPATAPLAAAQSPATATAEPAAQPAPGVDLHLSLDEAVKRALENNADIVVERYNPELSAEAVRSALGAYDPFVSATLSLLSADSRGTSTLAGGDVLNDKTDVWNFSAGLPIQLSGGTVQLGMANRKASTNNTNITFNPLYVSTLSLSLTQPLLRDFRIDAPRRALRIAKKNREISDVQFRATIVNTAAQVKSLYYDLIYAIDNLAVARKSLDLQKRLLNENEIRVKVGTMAPLDVVEAQSEVASREGGVITAENALAQAEDDLKRAIFAANDPAMWSTHVVPSDRPTAEPLPVDVEAAVRNALENRTDVVAARKGLERADISLSFARNQTLPDANLTATYGSSGAGGTAIIRDPATGVILNRIPGGYGDAVSQAFGRDFPNWEVRFNLAYSIPNRSARAAAAQARLTKEQALASFRRLQLTVTAEVRTAARGVESGFKSVQATQAARVLAVQRLDAEQKKFAAGMSTNFLVTQAQRDLAAAEVAELRAVLDYRRSVINLQRVQEAGFGGSGGSATF